MWRPWVGFALVVASCGGVATSESTHSGDGGDGPVSGGRGGTTSFDAGTADASAGTGGSAGVDAALGGSPGTDNGPCVGLSYCDCIAGNVACQVFAETCFCPCDIEPCSPPCDCDCGGGAYLGCGPASIVQPGAIEGIWLVGWSGGMNHFSWVRFNSDGTADVLEGADLPFNAPLWCSGQGFWSLAARPETIFLTLPDECRDHSLPLTFLALGPGATPPSVPSGSVLSATIDGGMGPTLDAYRFPATQCDAAMTQCLSPF